MIDLNIFIIKGKYKKKYKCTCDLCGKDRGFRYKEDSLNPCYECAIKIRNEKLNFNSLPIDDFIVHKENGNRYYKTHCKSCGNDRGYHRKCNIIKDCLSCARKKDHAKYPVNQSTILHRKIRHNMKTSIGRALKRHDGSKLGHSLSKLLPYSITELLIHLESLFEPWMTWENHGNYDKNRKTWHIDHIKPDSLFNYSSVNDHGFKDSWSLNNLQPLLAKDNLKKSNKYSK
jgi:hypothetical protein